MMFRISGTSLADSSSEMVDGMVARTHSAPSSRCGMNSAPIRVVSTMAAAKIPTQAPMVSRGRVRHQSSADPYRLRIHSKI